MVADARGLPRENYRKLLDGYRWLVDQGCVVVLGPMISDNCLTIQDLANELKVSCIGWTGAWKFASDYCFSIANGDIPTEGVICANWLYQQGIRKVGLFWESGSSGRDYADFFRDEAIRLGMTVTREVKLEPNPRDLQEHLAAMREAGTEGLYYGGYGYACFHFGAALQALEWDPPRIMGTAFMFYSNKNEWAGGIEGWHGIDQLGEDGANPNYNAMVQRFSKRFGQRGAQRGGRPRLRHGARRDPRDRQRGDSRASLGARRTRADPLDAGHERRPRLLHHLRSRGPQGLQGGLPHHP